VSKYTLNENHFGLTYIATGEQTDGRYFQCSTSIPVGDSGPPKHTHDFESEGFYVASGTLTLVVEDQEHVLQAGDYLNVLPRQPHTWSNKSDKTVELIITFSPSGIEDMFRELDMPSADIVSVGTKYGMTIVD